MVHLPRLRMKTVSLRHNLRTTVLVRNSLHSCQYAAETTLYQLMDVLLDAIQTKDIALHVEKCTSHAKIRDALICAQIRNTLDFWMAKT